MFYHYILLHWKKILCCLCYFGKFKKLSLTHFVGKWKCALGQVRNSDALIQGGELSIKLILNKIYLWNNCCPSDKCLITSLLIISYLWCSYLALSLLAKLLASLPCNSSICSIFLCLQFWAATYTTVRYVLTNIFLTLFFPLLLMSLQMFSCSSVRSFLLSRSLNSSMGKPIRVC